MKQENLNIKKKKKEEEEVENNRISKRKLFSHIYLSGQVIKSISNKAIYTYPDLFSLLFPKEEEGYSF